MKIQVVLYWGRQPLYQIKEGTLSSSVAAVKRLRNFNVGDVISYKPYVASTPERYAPWKRGRIWKLENDRIYLEQH